MKRLASVTSAATCATDFSDSKLRPSLLIVDDEPDILDFLDIFFSSTYNVMLARSGEEALQLMVTEQFDCVLSDYSMPGMNGGELIRAIKSKYESVKTVLHSASCPVEDLVACDLQIAKPTGLSRIAELLNELLAR